MSLLVLLYGIALAILLVYGIQGGLVGLYGKAGHFMKPLLGEQGHKWFHIAVGVSALVVLLFHLSLPFVNWQQHVFVVDGFASTPATGAGAATAHPAAAAAAASTAAHQPKTGCTKKDGSGNNVPCTFPQDASVSSCQPCAPESFSDGSDVKRPRGASEHMDEVMMHGEPLPNHVEETSLEYGPWVPV